MDRNVGALVAAMERIAPARLAAEWDNVGLLVGSSDWEAGSALLTTDLTAAVLDEAAQCGARSIVAYHPPIFAPLRTLTDATRAGRMALRAAVERIAVVSPHTALDAAPDGLGDWLAGTFAPGRISPLVPALELPRTEQVKLVTFCPETAVEGIRHALAGAGCGHIGGYGFCSFEMRGHGTFLGDESTNPAVGSRGALERVDEIRLEMVCARDVLAGAIGALRGAHPYEEPPIEIHPLEPRPSVAAGPGRRIDLAAPIDVHAAVALVKHRLGVAQLRVAAPAGLSAPVSRVGLCPGAGGELLEAALAAGCDAFLTGEMRHHDVLDASERGCVVLLAGHTNTERPYLPILAGRLRALLPGWEITVSAADRWPLEVG